MAGRFKSYHYMRRALQCSPPLPSSYQSAFSRQDNVAKLGFQVQRMLGGTHGLVSSAVTPATTEVPASDGPSSSSKTISVTFVDKHGDEKSIKVPLGMSMLEAAHQNDIELEGACEGSLACSTCHVIVMDEKFFNQLPEPTDEENDMLDLAFGLTETSRLGCQVVAKPELEGMRLAIPSATRNFAVDGYVPKPH